MLRLSHRLALAKLIADFERKRMTFPTSGFWQATPFVDRAMKIMPAHVSNYYSQRICKPIAGVFHEPQEPADDYESTPVYFSSPNRDASTRYYNDNDGDVYQLVPLERPAIANGLKGKPVPRFNDGGPEFGAYSINDQTENSEVEAYTATIAQTMTNAQWGGCVDLGVLWYVMWGWPRTVQRLLPHAYLASDRSDGLWIIEQSGIPQEVVKRVLKIDQQLAALEQENATRKGEIQEMFKQIYGDPFNAPTASNAKGLIQRVEKLEK